MIITSAMAFGALSAGTGILSSVGSFFGQKSATDARNKAAKEQYKRQLLIRSLNWQNKLNAYGKKKIQYQRQLDNNSIAATRAFEGENFKLAEMLKSQKFKSQEAMVLQTQALGKAQASLASGTSSAKIKQSIAAQAGRNQTVRDESLRSAYNFASLRNSRTLDQLNAANERAYADVQITPMSGPGPVAPAMESGPSPLGLIAGIGSAALDGISGYQTAKQW